MVRKTKTVSNAETTEVEIEETPEERYNNLVELVKSKLMPKSMIKKGGPEVRVKYSMEKNYETCIDDINKLGKELDKKPVSMGSLRED